MNKIQNAFNRAAESYDNHCYVQRHSGVKLTNLLKTHHLNAHHILDLGCGTGLTTQFLASHYEHQDFYAIDISTASLAKAKIKLDKLDIKLREMNFDNLSGINQFFDIIFSNMSLQWSEDLSSCLTNMRSLLQTNGTLAFAIPLAGTFREFEKYCAINAFDEHSAICAQLKQSGYSLLSAEKESITLAFPDALSALKSIKQIGANHVEKRIHKGLRTKSYFTKLNVNNLTYEIGYYIARKT